MSSVLGFDGWKWEKFGGVGSKYDAQKPATFNIDITFISKYT